VIKNLDLTLILLVSSFIIATMTRVLLGAHNKPPAITHMLLPHDFFISLVLSLSLWALLFLIMATKSLLVAYKPMLVIISSILALLLLWWCKNQQENKR
jgi:hypothetical protein